MASIKRNLKRIPDELNKVQCLDEYVRFRSLAKKRKAEKKQHSARNYANKAEAYKLAAEDGR